jgi:hypothetical protein
MVTAHRILLFILLMAFSLHAHGQSNFIPAVALAPNGTCAVVSSVSRGDGGGVFLVLCDTSGRRSQPIRVNDGYAGLGQNAAVCVDRANTFYVAWEQWGAATARVLIAHYGEDGTLLHAPVCAADDSTINAQTPRLAVSPDGSCSAVWLDYRLGHTAVYLQRFARGLMKTGKNMLVAESEDVLQTPVVALDAQHGEAIVWQAAMADSFHVCIRTSTHAGRWMPAAIVDDGQGKAYASTPDIVALPRGGYVVVWKDYRTGESDIYAQRVNDRGEKIGSNMRVNDDTTHRWQRLPRIVVSAAGIIVVWEDYRNDPGNQIGDIFAQRMDLQMHRVGRNFKVNDGPEPSIQRFPAAAMNAAGASAVVWDDGRSGTTAVWMRFYAPDGSASGEECKITQ